MQKKKEKGEGVERKGFIFAPTLPLLLIFSHSLAVSFPSRAFENERLLRRLELVLLLDTAFSSTNLGKTCHITS